MARFYKLCHLNRENMKGQHFMKLLKKLSDLKFCFHKDFKIQATEYTTNALLFIRTCRHDIAVISTCITFTLHPTALGTKPSSVKTNLLNLPKDLIVNPFLYYFYSRRHHMLISVYLSALTVFFDTLNKLNNLCINLNPR